MANADRTQQLAVLLNVIGGDAAQTAIDSLEPETAKVLNQFIDEFKSDPPSKSEIDFVLEDFERFFTFALDHIQTELEEAEKEAVEAVEAASAPPGETEDPFNGDLESLKYFAKPKLTGDIKQDLNLLHPYQIAHAIQNDNPTAIAVVIKNLADANAAKTLETLPDEIRKLVFLQMANPARIMPKVETQILHAAFATASKIETRAPEEDQKGQIVALMRSLPKEIRGDLLEKLKEEFPDLADEVKTDMYQFGDITRLGDRDVQKILAQSDSDSLVLALVDADDELKEKLLGNMSARARQTIEDELEFKTNAPADEIQSGKRQIVEVLAKLDESGEISLE